MGRWRAWISRRYLGTFDTPEEAADHSGVAVTIDTALIDTSLVE